MAETTVAVPAEEDAEKLETTKERRSGWTIPTWLMSGLFTMSVAIVGIAISMWSNDSVQDTNINYALKQIEELKTENRALRSGQDANKQHLDTFAGEALDLMRRLTEQDRFRKQR